MSGYRAKAIQLAVQAKMEARAARMRRVSPGAKWGSILIAALVLAALLGACGGAGASNVAQPAATRCVSGQANTLKSGMITWNGLFSTNWMVNQAQHVTITPDASLPGGLFQVTSTPVSLRLGQQAITTPPAFSLHVGETLARVPSYPVTLSLPIAGCWKITAQLDNASSSIFIRADAPPGASACPFSTPSPEVAPGDEFAYGADPIFWALTPPYAVNQPIYLTLRVTKDFHLASLPLTAVQIANQGKIINFSVVQAQISSSDSGVFYQNAAPLTLPAAGCWLFSASAGSINGTVVIQAQ